MPHACAHSMHVHLTDMFTITCLRNSVYQLCMRVWSYRSQRLWPSTMKPFSQPYQSPTLPYPTLPYLSSALITLSLCSHDPDHYGQQCVCPSVFCLGLSNLLVQAITLVMSFHILFNRSHSHVSIHVLPKGSRRKKKEFKRPTFEN